MQGQEKERHENQFILSGAFAVGEGDKKDMRIKVIIYFDWSTEDVCTTRTNKIGIRIV